MASIKDRHNFQMIHSAVFSYFNTSRILANLNLYWPESLAYLLAVLGDVGSLGLTAFSDLCLGSINLSICIGDILPWHGTGYCLSLSSYSASSCFLSGASEYYHCSYSLVDYWFPLLGSAVLITLVSFTWLFALCGELSNALQLPSQVGLVVFLSISTELTLSLTTGYRTQSFSFVHQMTLTAATLPALAAAVYVSGTSGNSHEGRFIGVSYAILVWPLVSIIATAL